MPDAKFDPAAHLTKIGRKDYLPVQARLLWLDAMVERYTIDTELVSVTDTSALARATVTILNPDGEIVRRGTDFKSQNIDEFADFIEKALTGAIGRALAQLGYGTQFAAEISDDQAGGPESARRGGERPTARSSGRAGGGDQEITGWSDFWPRARSLGYTNKAEVEAAIGRTMDGLGFQELFGLLSRLKEPAAAPEVSPRAGQPAASGNSMTSAEAALIRFRERAEGGGDWLALLEEAGGRDDYLAELAAAAPTLGQLNAVTDRAKKLGRYSAPVIAADQHARARLQPQPAAKRR